MKKSKKLITSLALSALMAIQPIACYADSAPWDEPGETFSHTFEVRVVEAYKDDAFIGGLEARLVEYKFDYDDKHHAGDYIRTIAEFTTSDTEPTYITCDDVSTTCVYILEIDELPENHSYFGKASVAKYHGGYDLANPPYNPYIIYLWDEPPYEVWEDFPITKTVDWETQIYDLTKYNNQDENPTIQGIDVEIVKINQDEDGNFSVGDFIGNYNTSEPIKFTTEETFNSEDDSVFFGYKFENVPSGYEQEVERLADPTYSSIIGGKICDGY
ncbi:MAG: hypothetical protein K2J39_05515 [Ruminococcus sp.]|nr:hypothetical protein [Ruminococcus sp.]